MYHQFNTLLILCIQFRSQAVPCTTINITLGDSNAVVVKCGKNWTEARQYCSDRNSGLLEIYNQATHSQVESELKKNSIKNNIWLGAEDIYRNNTWYWNSGRPVNFTMWWYSIQFITKWNQQPDDPSAAEFCLVLQKNFWNKYRWWHNHKCKENYYFICQERSYAQSTTKVRPTTATNIADTIATDYNTIVTMETAHNNVISTSSEYTPNTSPGTSNTVSTTNNAMANSFKSDSSNVTEIGVGVGVAIFVLVVIGVVAGILIYRRNKEQPAGETLQRQSSVANDYTSITPTDHNKQIESTDLYNDYAEPNKTNAQEPHANTEYSEVGSKVNKHNQYSSINKHPTTKSDQVIMVSNDIYDDSDSVMVDNDLYGD